MKHILRSASLLLLLSVLLSLLSCGIGTDDLQGAADALDSILQIETTEDTSPRTEPAQTTDLPSDTTDAPSDAALPDENGKYYDVESVVAYLDAYHHLPSNFVTKKAAENKGWQGGSVEKYIPGGAIGGDTFGNREGLLPKQKGRVYTECDIDTKGQSSRGAKRLVFSNDGLYFYTDDHYEHFTQITLTEGGKIEWH